MSVIDPIYSLFNDLSAGLAGMPDEQSKGMEETLHKLHCTVDSLVESNTLSERRLRELVQYAPTAMYEVDFRSGKFSSVNDWMIELSGYSREELLNMSALDLLDDEGKLLFRQRMQCWLAGEPPEENVEYRVKAKDGRTIYAVLDVSFTRDEAGRPLGASVIGHDVTQRKQMEQAVADSERKYRELVQHAATAIYEVDFRTQKFTVINDAMILLTGYSREELLRMSPFDLLDDESSELLRERTRLWQVGEHPDASVEYRIRKKDGGFIDAVLHSTFTWDENGRPLRASVIAHDITQRKAMEEALRASENRERARAAELQALMDTVPAMIWLTRDPQANEITANRHAFEFFRLPYPDDTLNQTTGEGLARKSFELMKDGRVIPQADLPLRYTAATGKPVEGQTMDVVFAGGSTYQVLTNVNPLLDADGKPAGAVSVMIDITNLRRLESEHQEAITNMEIQRLLMEQREQDRNAIARDLHDGPIQTLSSTLFHLQMVKEVFPDPALTGELKHVGDEIKRTVQELRELLNELRPPALIQFGFIKVMRMFIEDFRERYPEVAIELEITADDAPLSNLAHLTLFRIFQAGINNIIRHANAGHVWVSFASGPDCYFLEIRDDGRGFEVPDDFSELTRHSHFGLVGMKERAEAICGEFKVSSAYGQGTKILIKCPCNEKNIKPGQG